VKYFYILAFLTSWINIYSQEDIFSNEWVQRNFTEPVNTKSYTDNPGGKEVTIRVAIDDTINKTLPTIFGNNLPGWRRQLLGNVEMEEHVKNLNLRTMRIPGGNWSNTWLWDGINHWDGTNQDGYRGTFKNYDNTTNYLDKITSAPVKNWTYTTDNMLQTCENWGVEPQICVNYALTRYIDATDALQQAAHYAAEWVRDVKRKGITVRYWEIGNEHYGSWQAGYIVERDTLTGAKYGSDACVFIDSMKAADPDIKVGIVVYPEADYRTMPNYTPEVLMAAGDKADYLISHDYFTWAKDPNDVAYSDILNELSQIKFDYDTIQAMVKLYTGKKSMPVAMTEYNYTGGLKETEGVASIFFARAIGEYIKNNYRLVNYWDIQNGNTAEDHGMFTLGEDGVEDNIPHPSFFPYYLYNKMFGDAMIESTCYDDDISVYASKYSNGYLGITVINQSGNEKTLKINVPRYIISDTVYRYELSTEALSSRKIYINGETSPEGELYGPRNYSDIAPYRQVLSSANPAMLGAKKYSVNFFVIRIKEFTAIRNRKAPSFALSVSPNPSKGSVNISYDIPVESSVTLQLYNNYGQLIKVLTEERAYPGKHTQRYDLSNLSPGIYIVKLSSNLGSDSQKLVIKF